MQPDNRIRLLHPTVRQQCLELLSECLKQGIHLIVTQTFRSFEHQAGLYARGRTIKGPKVTNAPPGFSWHNWGLAFDVAIKHFDGDLTPKDVYDGPWDTVGSIGESLSLEWGGHWKHLDRPHFQNTLGWTIRRLLEKYPRGLLNATWPQSEPRSAGAVPHLVGTKPLRTQT